MEFLLFEEMCCSGIGHWPYSTDGPLRGIVSRSGAPRPREDWPVVGGPCPHRAHRLRRTPTSTSRPVAAGVAPPTMTPECLPIADQLSASVATEPTDSIDLGPPERWNRQG